MYKLVLIDIDDTLLNDSREISPDTKTIIKKAQERNVTISLATGRMYVSARQIADEIGGNIPLITYQGALIKDLDGNVLCEWSVPSGVIEKVIHYCQEGDYHLHIYSGDKLYVKERNQKVEFYAEMHKVSYNVEPNFEYFIKEPVTKMVIFEDPDVIDKIIIELSACIGETAYITKSKPFFLEILHPDASKANAVEILCKYCRCDVSEVIAIGDSWNDIGMLEKVGLAVAMGNAVEELKIKADVITSSNNEEGVRKVIEEYILD